jgi:hypothetical protein
VKSGVELLGGVGLDVVRYLIGLRSALTGM